MSLRAATPGLVGDRVQRILAKRPDARAMVLRARPDWDGGELNVDGHRVVVRACPSPLAVRATLTDWASEQATPSSEEEPVDLLVVLCDLAEADLGADVMARFTPPRVEGLDPWQAAEGLFGVAKVDAAFRKEDGWVADALLAHVPGDVARTKTVGGVLTIEVAHDALARVLLGADSLSVDAVLAAAAAPKPFAGLIDVDPVVRAGLLDALARQSPLGALVASVIDRDGGGDLLALGLVARAIYGHGEHDGGKAAGHFEARCGDLTIAPGVGAGLAQRSEEVVVALLATDRDRGNALVAEAAALADQIGATHPEDSDLLPAGFDRRLAVAAGTIDAVLDALPADPAAVVEGARPDLGGIAAAVARAEAHQHRRTVTGGARCDHLDMAARLTAWLATPPTAPAVAFEEAATAYAASSAWVDQARRRLWLGDGDPAVGSVYRRVLDAVVARRRVENERFARLLAAWTTTPSSSEVRVAGGIVAVEDVAATVLAPLAANRLLFVVLDGCGLASFTELASQFSETGYREITRTASGAGGEMGRRLTGIAALPTVTQVSRASLIAGRLDQGNQDHERRQFADNPALSYAGRAAVFFHQNALRGAAGSSLSVEVAHAIGPDGPVVVGVVINTIDDNLKKGTFTERLHLRDLHALGSLLDEARTHGRTVVVSADHGHVLSQPEDGGHGAYQGGGSGGERWRTADRAPGDNEVVLRGDRVLLGGDAGILAPFDDDFRYAAKAGGYHGGATPEEVLVPVAVFIPAGIDPPSGWDLDAPVPPLWWDLQLAHPLVTGTGGAPTEPTGATKPRRKPKPVDESQPAMFEVPVEPTPPPAAVGAPAGAEPVWLGPLLASEVWKLQKGAVARAQLPDDRVRLTLAAVANRGGVASFAALAADTGIPISRLSGFLALLARVLNVDGYVVLDVDATTTEVRLSLPTLAQQFEIAVTEP